MGNKPNHIWKFCIFMLFLSLVLAEFGVYMIVRLGDWLEGVSGLFAGVSCLAVTLCIIIRNENRKNIVLYMIGLILAVPLFWLLVTGQFLIFFFGWLQ